MGQLRGGRRPFGERQRPTVPRRDRRSLIPAGAVAGCFCSVGLLVLPGPAMVRGFVAGVLAATTVWLVVLRLVVLTYARTLGVRAEKQSRDLISGVPQWLAVHDVPLDGRNIDHVVITPLAVLAVETTWWGPASPAVHRRRREAALDRARRNARTVKHLLASRDPGFSLPVWPVVLTWGPGAEETRLGPVDVVGGEDPGGWLAAYQTGAIPFALAEQVQASLLRYQAGHDARSTTDDEHPRAGAA